MRFEGYSSLLHLHKNVYVFKIAKNKFYPFIDLTHKSLQKKILKNKQDSIDQTATSVIAADCILVGQPSQTSDSMMVPT